MSVGSERRTPNEWLSHYGAVVLFLAGAALLALGLLVEAEAKAVPLIVMGGGAVVLAVLLPRVAGLLKLGPQGLEVLVSAVEVVREQAKDLPPEKQVNAVERAVEIYAKTGGVIGGGRLGGRVNVRLAAEHLAEQAVNEARMSDYALLIGTEDSGPYTEEELRQKLEEYRERHPEDPDFSNVAIHEMTAHSTAGTPRSPHEFLD